jgi:signal peptidase I
MTSASGDNPPRSEEGDQVDTPPPPSETTGTEPTSQANLWSEDESESALEAGEASANSPDDVWSRRRHDVAATDSPAAVDDADAVTADGTTSVSVAEDVGDDDEAFSRDESNGSSGGVKARRVAWELVQTLVLAALIFLLVRGVAQNFRVEGPSMQPGLHNGEYLLVNKAVYFKLDLDKLGKYIPFIDGGDHPSRFLFHGPQRGDVIVFRYPRDPSRDFIKRIIGIPGDTVSISNGVVTVNGTTLDEPYIAPGSNTDMEAKVVPEDSYFVMGDNRPNSSDSRNWGFVPEENIIGKAMFAYWPTSDFGGVGNRSIDLGFIKVPVPLF